jgi:uncharacterized protein
MPTPTPATAPAPARARHGTLVLRGVVGSTAYGLNHAGSDQDRLGVFVAPTTAVLGLRGQAFTITSQVTGDPDQTLHEVGKFVSLAAKSNPTVTELLWLSEYDHVTPDGAELLGIRQAFLCTDHVRGAYGGYAIAQARKLRDRSAAGSAGFSANTGNRTAKHGRHCLRLLRQGRHLLATGQLLVNVAHLRDELFAAGELAEADPDAFHRLFESEKEAFDATVSVLADQPDLDTVNDVLVDIRRRHLA